MNSLKTRSNGEQRNDDRNRGTKHLPYLDLMDRKARGICFRCGERFHPLHQCAEKQLCLVIIGDNETINDADEVIVIELMEDERETPLECHCLKLCEVENGNNVKKPLPTTLTLQGMVKGECIMIMVNTGASDNFVTPQLAAFLQLTVERIKATNVRFGNGSDGTTAEKCGRFDIQFGKFNTTMEAYILELEEVDMILSGDSLC